MIQFFCRYCVHHTWYFSCSLQTVCPLNDPLEYTVEVIGSPYQTGIVQIRKDRGRKEILLLGVTVPINSIAKLQNLTFNISFHYRRGRVHSIPLLGWFPACLALFLLQALLTSSQ